MKLLAGGCSLIYGTEISDATTGPSQLTYPALLARQFGLEYSCTANPGDGNDSICRKIIEAVDDEVGLVVVTWSYHDRFEFNYNNHGWQSLKNPNSMFVEQINQLAKPFYADLTEVYSWSKYIQDIVLLQTFLINKGIPFIFSSADDAFFNDSIVIKSDALYQQLYSLIDFTKWIYWHDSANNKVGFVKWAKTHNYPMGNNGHPLELAHANTYKLVKPQVEMIL